MIEITGPIDVVIYGRIINRLFCCAYGDTVTIVYKQTNAKNSRQSRNKDLILSSLFATHCIQ